jgi:hypothetical protein
MMRLLPLFAKLEWPLTPRMIEAFQVTMSQLRDWLTSQPRTALYEFQFQAPAIPTLKTDYSSAPRGVMAVSFDNVTDATYATPPGALSWYFRDGYIYFPSFGGIAGTDKYRMRVLVVEAG